MNTVKKSEMIENLEFAIRRTISKAKAVHRHYLQAIRQGDFSRQCRESELRSDLLECARMMKNAMLPRGRKIRPYGYLCKVQARRWERYDHATHTER